MQNRESLQICSSIKCFKTKEGYEVSFYKGEELTKKCATDQIVKIKKAFPELPIEFYDVFIDRLKENSFNNDRLIDAVNHVIDTCEFPKPTIAKFVSYDRRVKLRDHVYMSDLAQKWGAKVWKDYKKIKVNDVMYWYNFNENEYLL